MKARTIGSVVVAVFAAAAVLLFLFVPTAPVEAVYPVERLKTGVFRGLRTRVSSWFRAQAVVGENVRLKRAVASLSIALGDVQAVEMENARLRRALDYASKSPERLVAAEVLSTGGAAAGFRKTIRVGKGMLEGVREGAVVVVPEGLVGRVASVTPHTAEVMLVTDASVQVGCEIEADVTPKMRGVLACDEDGRLALRHLRNVAEVPPGSRVLTSGLGGVFPKGVEVGTIVSVAEGPSGLVGTVSPSVDFPSLEEVFIRREK